MKAKWVLWLGSFLLLGWLFFYSLPKHNKDLQVKYDNFHKTVIGGRLSYVDHRPSFTTCFQVAGDTETNTWVIVGINETKGKRFRDIAQEGDSIFKKSNSDIVVILKNERKYLFKVVY